ncbi:MAG TPA: TAT-variant-translocated molybdopterin oxidoreductase [Vicinamibacterales bacterium]|nr:TAT-variant-translocated molybdopterin oxidoreductase [Vicinamibacterales bacterium]
MSDHANHRDPAAAPDARANDYWRSLEELADTEAFREALHREFPQGASELTDPVSRRTMLKLMGASLALAGVTACTRQPAERIFPYVRQPEDLVPGRPLFFATAMPLAGYASALLVESHEGRPTKVEGNPEHPVNRGATDAFAQASILGLYDPDRSGTLTYLGEIRPWGAFISAAKAAVEARRAQGGAGLALLTGAVTSPTLGDQIRALQAEFPAMKWHQWEPVGRGQVGAGAALAFGSPVETHYQLGEAAVILSLDADFLSCGPASVRLAREFANGRRLRDGRREMNRLYAVEATPTLTGSVADHRLPLQAASIHGFALALAAALGVPGLPAPRDGSAHAGWVAPLARDLQAHRGRSAVIVGDEQSPAVHAIGHAINQALGNVGATVVYSDPIEVAPTDALASLRELADDLEAGRVETLFILGVNPVYTAPVDLQFADRLLKANLRFHLGLHHDETAALCQWHIPEAHYLESWGDVRAADGTVTLIQPLIAPLHGGRSAYEVLGALGKQAGQNAYSIVRSYWQGQLAPKDDDAFERQWRQALHDGFVPGTAVAPRAVTAGSLGERAAEPPPREGLELLFRPDPSIYDGRFANNPWLQELPKAHTKLTWDNAALVSPATAARLGVANEDVVELRYRGRRLKAPVWILPGQAPDTVTVHLGYGRTNGGRVAQGAGFNAYLLRTTAALWTDGGLEVAKTGEQYALASAQNQQMIDERPVVRSGSLEEFRKHPEFAHEMGHEPPRTLTLYPEHEYKGNAWGMAIDLNTCIGCNACVVACNAENNIPVVGKVEVGRGHRMHWLRVDRYYRGDPENPESFNQPVPCMHCENAPCEVVCPTVATVHSAEGLNDMIYNRCVGTRYCSNNCPYKVRRFNFFLYQDWTTPTLKMARNPDVTVRSRGVMEKCTYCVQRINQARVSAAKENRPIRDGEVVTACAAACPSQAIVFGNINDPASVVAKTKAEPLNYSLLGDLNTRPRTTYLAAVRNVNPEMPGARAGGGEGGHEGER